MKIMTQRVYDGGEEGGYRVLVDRLWPRGITKDRAALDDWWKDLAPSPALRTWFGHDEKKFLEFRRKYMHELREQKARAVELMGSIPKRRRLVLLYGAKSESCNHAVVLKDYLEGF